jgi:hypothetical protein
MRILGKLGLIGAGVGLMLTAGIARAQQQGGCTFTDESGKTVFWPNCQDPAEKKSPDGTSPPANGQTPTPGQSTQSGAPGSAPGSSVPAKSFPFPGDGAAPAGNGQAGQQGATGSGSGSPTAGKFPFPEQDSGGSGPLRDSGSSGNAPSSSSSSSSSSGPPDRDPSAGPLGDGDDDPAAKAAEARRAARPKKGIEFHQTADQRETEDLKIAAFYQDDGNFRGAYERATDAVSLAADDADAHFALAEAARRLGKLDEALTHYKKCLTLDPVDKTRKAAEKALKQMTAGG